VTPEPFLVVLFSTLHSKPEFYECVTVCGRRQLDYALSTCHDVVQLNTVCTVKVKLGYVIVRSKA